MNKKLDTNRDERITREDEQREQYYMSYTGPLSIVDRIREEGKSYIWARRSILGQDDFRVEELTMKGWSPVPASRAPHFAVDPLNRNPLSNKFIVYKDTILMERPSHLCQQENTMLRQQNRNAIRNLRGVSDDYAVNSFHSIR